MGILGDLKNKCYSCVASAVGSDGNEYTYATTAGGLLCVFTKSRLLDRWIDLQVLFLTNF